MSRKRGQHPAALLLLALLLAYQQQATAAPKEDKQPELDFQTDPKCKCDGCSKFEVGPAEKATIDIPKAGGVRFYVRGDERFFRGDDIYQVEVRSKLNGVLLMERSTSCYSDRYEGTAADDYTVTLVCLNQVFPCKLTAGAIGTPVPLPSPKPSPPPPSPKPKAPAVNTTRNSTMDPLISSFDANSTLNDSSIGTIPPPELSITYTPLNLTRPWLNAAPRSHSAAASQLIATLAALVAAAVAL